MFFVLTLSGPIWIGLLNTIHVTDSKQGGVGIDPLYTYLRKFDKPSCSIGNICRMFIPLGIFISCSVRKNEIKSVKMCKGKISKIYYQLLV